MVSIHLEVFLEANQGSVLFQPGDGRKRLTWQSCVFSLGRSVSSSEGKPGGTKKLSKRPGSAVIH